MTTFTIVTSTAWPMVSLSAAAVDGLESACQYPLHPLPVAFTTTAVSGMRTSRLSQMLTTPSVSAEPRVSGAPSSREPTLPATTPAASVPVTWCPYPMRSGYA